MLKKIFMSLHDSGGAVVWYSSLEEGIEDRQARGRKPWLDAIDYDREKVRGAYALCLLDGISISISATYEFNGRQLRYRSSYHPVQIGAVAMLGVHRRVPLEIHRLSDRERQMLILYAKGHKTEAVARRMGLTRSTVNTYRQRICRKVGLAGIEQLIAFAVEHFSDHADPTRGS